MTSNIVGYPKATIGTPEAIYSKIFNGEQYCIVGTSLDHIPSNTSDAT